MIPTPHIPTDFDSPFKTTVVFEDENLKVIYREGSSEFLFCTFGNLKNLAVGLQFFADVPAAKLDLSCLGFMTKTPNWFPKSSMAAAHIGVKHILDSFSQRFGYGGSMGGYAAVKYSNLLQLDYSLVFCPQWSIDPAECNGSKNGYEKYFIRGMEGMSIKPNDTFGKIFLLSDPHHPVDEFHSSKIRSLNDDITYLAVKTTDHHVTTLLVGSQRMASMIQMVRSGDVGSFTQMICSVRRDSPIRTKALLVRAARRHPSLVNNVLHSSKRASTLKPYQVENLNIAVLEELWRKDKHFDAMLAVTRMIEASENPVKTNQLLRICKALRLKAERTLFALSTHHHTILTFDSIRFQLCHIAPTFFNEFPGRYINVVIQTINDSNLLTMSLDDVLYGFIADTESSLAIEEINESTSSNSFIKASKARGGFCFPTATGFLCADRKGKVTAFRPAVKKWEIFRQRALSQRPN